MKNIFNQAISRVNEPKIWLRRMSQIAKGIGYNSDNFIGEHPPNDNEYYVVRTSSGEGVFQMKDGGEFTLTEHTVIILKTDEVQRWHCKKADWIYGFYTFATDDTSYLNLNKMCSIAITETERRIADDCFTNLGSDSHHEMAYAQNLFKSLLSLWHIKPEHRSLRESNIEHTLDYATRTLSSKMTVSQVAETLNMSEQKLRQMFITYTGLPPKRYMEEKKLKTALELLEATTMTIKEIALQCGFCDQFHFNKRFKKRFGISPKMARTKLIVD